MWNQKFEIDGVYVHRSGDGPSLVLLHANGGDANDFDSIVDHLALTHTVFGIDWPGWGESHVNEEPTALGYAELLPRILEQLPGGPFMLLGNSVGGFAAIRTAAVRPDLVRSLVLVDPGGFTPNWFGTRMACRLIGSPLLSPWMMRVLPHLYLRRRTEAVKVILAHAKQLSHDGKSVQSFGSIWRSFAARDHDARDAAALITVPTLLVWGRSDPVLPWLVDGRRAQRALPHAEVVRLACGHQGFAEVPEEFLKVLDAFLVKSAIEHE